MNIKSTYAYLLIVLLFMNYSAAQAQDRVKSIDPVVVRMDDGSVKTCKISAKSYDIWDKRDIVQLGGLSVSGCGNGSFMFEKPITIHAESGSSITIPAHRTVLFLSNGGAQIDVKQNEKGGVVVESGTQHDQSQKIYLTFKEQKKETASLIDQLNSAIAKRNYSAARELYSKIVNKNELYSEEIKKINTSFQAMPEKERPIRTFDNDSRWEMDSMRKTFGGVDFDKMTVKEYIAFVKDWADHPEKYTSEGDQTYLYRFMKHVGVPENEQYNLAYRAYASRMSSILKSCKENKSPNFNDTYVVEASLTQIKYLPKGTEFFSMFKKNLSMREPEELKCLKSKIFGFNEFMPEQTKTEVRYDDEKTVAPIAK